MQKQRVPLAGQLIQELATDISSGNIIDEDGRLPSEADLRQRYGVSRATVREALAKLETAGVLVRRHGIGTFITQFIHHNPQTIWGWLDEAPAFADLIQQSGHTADCRVLAVEQRTAGENSVYFNISSEEPIVYIEKLFLADDQPVIYSETRLPFALIAHDAEAAALATAVYQKTIFEIMQIHGRHAVHHQTSEIQAITAEGKLAEVLNCDLGAPLLVVEELGYSAAQAVLFYAVHYFRGDRISFRQIRVPTFMVADMERG